MAALLNNQTAVPDWFRPDTAIGLRLCLLPQRGGFCEDRTPRSSLLRKRFRTCSAKGAAGCQMFYFGGAVAGGGEDCRSVLAGCGGRLVDREFARPSS